MSLSVKVARSRSSGVRPGVGDPGLLGWIGSAIGTVTGIASKVLPGPLGAAAGAISKLTRPTARPPTPRPIEGSAAWIPMADFGPQMPQVPKPGVVGQLERWVPGGQTGMMDQPGIGAPAGYHVNKTDYFLKDGTFIPAGSRWVKNRHRNPLNPRAASKAIGRLESLKRATARFSRITIRKPCCKHGGKKKK